MPFITYRFPCFVIELNLDFQSLNMKIHLKNTFLNHNPFEINTASLLLCDKLYILNYINHKLHLNLNFV